MKKRALCILATTLAGSIFVLPAHALQDKHSPSGDCGGVARAGNTKAIAAPCSSTDINVRHVASRSYRTAQANANAAQVAPTGSSPGARAGTAADRRRAVEDIIRALGPLEADSADARRIATMLRLMLDRERIQRESDIGTSLAGLQTGLGPDRLRSLQSLSGEVLDRARHFTRMMAAGEYSPEDAVRLLNIAKYSAQFLDDLRKPGGAVSGENQTRATKFLATAYGVAAVLEGSRGGDARMIVDGLRDLSANSSRLAGSIGPVIDIPAETVGAMVNVSRKGMIIASDAIADIEAAMAGDSAAIPRAIARARELEATLSGESYGKAMKDALQSRLADKVPGLRTVLNLWPEDGLPTQEGVASPAPKDVAFRWHWSARHPSVNNGRDILVCGPSPYRSTAAIYGTREYADDSALCLAAVHAGAIGWKGGRIKVTLFDSPGSPLVGSVQHGVESQTGYTSWRRRFTVEAVDVTR